MVLLGIEDEFFARESPIAPLRLVEDWYVRLDATLMDQPAQHLGGTVGGVGGEPLGIEIKALIRPLDHPLSRRHLRLLPAAARFLRPQPLGTGGEVADCRVADHLLSGLSADALVLADKGYDTDVIRRQIEEAGAIPNIPPKANRTWNCCFSPQLYRGRNAIERMFGRLKDFRRIATRYDRMAKNFLAAVCLAATVSYWL